MFTAFFACIYFSIMGADPADAIARLHGNDEVVWPSEMGIAIPREAERVLKRGLELDFEDRIQDFEEVLVLMDRALDRAYDEQEEKPQRKSAKKAPSVSKEASNPVEMKDLKPRFSRAVLIASVLFGALAAGVLSTYSVVNSGTDLLHAASTSAWSVFAIMSFIASVSRHKVCASVCGCLSLVGMAVLLAISFGWQAAPFIGGVGCLAATLVADVVLSRLVSPLPAITALASLGLAICCAAGQSAFVPLGVLLGAAFASVVVSGLWKAFMGDIGRMVFLWVVFGGYSFFALSGLATRTGGEPYLFAHIGGFTLNLILIVLCCLPIVVACAMGLVKGFLKNRYVGFLGGVTFVFVLLFAFTLIVETQSLLTVALLGLGVMQVVCALEKNKWRVFAIVAFVVAAGIAVIVNPYDFLFYDNLITSFYRVDAQDAGLLGHGFAYVPSSWASPPEGYDAVTHYWGALSSKYTVFAVINALGVLGIIVVVCAGLTLLVYAFMHARSEAVPDEARQISASSMLVLGLLALIACENAFGPIRVPYADSPFLPSNTAYWVFSAMLSAFVMFFGQPIRQFNLREPADWGLFMQSIKLSNRRRPVDWDFSAEEENPLETQEETEDL